MIRTLLTTTALSVLLTAGALAQDAAPAAPPAPPPVEAAPPPPPAPDAAPMAPADPAMDPAAPAPAPMAPADPAMDPATPAPSETGAMETTDMDEPWDMATGYTAVDTDNLASELIDQPVYSSTGDDAENIGNVSDLIFSEDGSISAVVIGVGGFLGIGEKSVAVDFQMLQFTTAADNTERWVVETTADALNAAPDFVWAKDEPADAGATTGTDGGAMAPADGGAMAPADTTTTAPAM
ncbi:PRC-barrel domain-containing protein [uncultured Devosia sp.]|uniref:PRC-barrel domain-containing protein n=1 Tax=uncultured Devosia sp. TaxID=211434 RepID=UPI0035CC5BE4